MKKLISFFILLLLLPGCVSTETAVNNHFPASEPTLYQAAESPSELPQEEVPMEICNVTLVDPKDTDLVRVRDFIPDILEDIKYATEDNFTGTVIYSFQDVYLRYGTVKKLIAVQEELRILGLGLKIWDGFRPVSAQFKLWDILPDDTYVANPNKGFSNHSRGNAVDLTMVDANGKELEMPTAFDDFSSRADRDYSEIPEMPRAHAELLQQIMERHGFQGYYGEWWHFNDTRRYDVETVFDPEIISLRQIQPEDSASVFSLPSDAETPICTIPAGETVTLLGYDEGFALISWMGIRGFVCLECICSG